MNDSQREDLHYIEKTIESTGEFIVFIEQLLSLHSNSAINLFTDDTQFCIKITNKVDMDEVRKYITGKLFVRGLILFLKERGD